MAVLQRAITQFVIFMLVNYRFVTWTLEFTITKKHRYSAKFYLEYFLVILIKHHLVELTILRMVASWLVMSELINNQ